MVINVKDNRKNENYTDKGLIYVWLIILLVNIQYLFGEYTIFIW
jgi:hypothetical protein